MPQACEEMSQGDCEHNVEERAFTGNWVSDELKRAVSVGYEVLTVYEIWQFETVRYDKGTNKSGLFEVYIDTFLKLMQEGN